MDHERAPETASGAVIVPSAFADLIERLERAQSFNRVLDGDIALYLGWTYEKMKGDAKPYWRKPDAKEYWERARTGPPEYTRSIDAALTLVPDGARVRELGQWDEHGQPSGWFANVTRYFKTDAGWECRSFTFGIQDPMDYHPKVPPLAPNGAIALCIAALKARAATMTAPTLATNSTPS